jgi:hypothetical protein
MRPALSPRSNGRGRSWPEHQATQITFRRPDVVVIFEASSHTPIYERVEEELTGKAS